MVRVAIEQLCKDIGLPADNMRCVPLSGGRNNRAYCLELECGRFLLKQYFAGGEWDRLATESRFLRFCEQARIKNVARLLAVDEREGLALHSWIDGVALRPGEVDQQDVGRVAAFLAELVDATQITDSRLLPPPARDACLCLEDFFCSPKQRMEELADALAGGIDQPMVAEAETFFREWLLPAWELTEANARNMLSGFDLKQALPMDMLITSPSDIGFHNALRLNNSSLAFVDFEYAGLDSQIKPICDFICQPSFPPPRRSAEILTQAIRPDIGSTKELMQLITTILPLCRIKFCCIILNDFKNLDAQRRTFSLSGDPSLRLRTQLDKARRYLSRHHEI